MTVRMKELYEKQAVPALKEKFAYKNPNQVPRLEKIVINIGLGKAVLEPKIMDYATTELGRITGQKPVITKAKKAIANFKLREGMPIGCMVTLRTKHMYEFLDRLISITLPRVRDFRGVSDKGFDNAGNYTMGVKDHTIFPEIDIDNVQSNLGMNITFVNSASSKEEGHELLRLMGMPFRKRS